MRAAVMPGKWFVVADIPLPGPGPGAELVTTPAWGLCAFALHGPGPGGALVEVSCHAGSARTMDRGGDIAIDRDFHAEMVERRPDTRSKA